MADVLVPSVIFGVVMIPVALIVVAPVIAPPAAIPPPLVMSPVVLIVLTFEIDFVCILIPLVLNCAVTTLSFMRLKIPSDTNLSPVSWSVAHAIISVLNVTFPSRCNTLPVDAVTVPDDVMLPHPSVPMPDTLPDAPIVIVFRVVTPVI